MQQIDQEKLFQEIIKLEMGETRTLKLTENRFLFVNNWADGDGDKFTSLELNSGEDTGKEYILDEILECGTYDFQNEAEIRCGIEYMICCCD